MGIGQGFFQATPLQMANAYSTLANHGILRTPLLVRKITTVDGQIVKAYQAEEKARVPISQSTFDSILSGLKKTGTTPKGTGYYAFSTFKTPLAAKTGSAENQNPSAHAWFAGWAPADGPEVLVIAMIEGGQAGSTVAAPRGRLMMDFFFPGSPPQPGVTTAPPPSPTPTAGPGQPGTQPTPTAAPKPPAPPAPSATPKPSPTPKPTPKPGG
jgi:penicillin-binding protein 2